MSDIATLETEIRNLLETLDKDLQSIKKSNPSQRAKQINRCQYKVFEIRTRIEAYELETLQLDKYAQIKHKEILKELQNQYKELKTQFEKKKNERADGNSRLATEEGLERNLDEMTGQELIQVGNQYQQKGKDALHRVLGQIESANQHADHINLELVRQEETIARSKEKAQDVQTQLKRAGKYLKYFARQVYTDKLLMCLICLCVVAIIVIIVLKIVQKQPLPTVKDIV